MVDSRPDLSMSQSYRLNLLGPFNFARTNDACFVVSTKKNRALLAILALSLDRKASRERLCGLLWGDRSEDHARSSLRQSLAVLRKELGEASTEILRVSDDQISLQSVTLDTDCITRASLSNDISELRQAASLVRGELLSDTTVMEEAF